MASESGRGQTKSSNTLGVRTASCHHEVLAEANGKLYRRRWESCRRKEVVDSSIQSTIGHVESDGNTGGPPSKPKYYLMTDSGAVLWRKGEKNPGRGVKENLKPYAYKHIEHVNVWYGTFCRTVRRVNVCSEVKLFSNGAAGKPRVNSPTLVACIRPETGWPIHEQVEGRVKPTGGPNRPPLKSWRMTCG